MSLLRRRRRHGRVLPAVLVLLGVLALAGCGGSSTPSTATTTASSASGCRTVPSPGFTTRSEKAPTALLPAAEHVSITFETNCGNFTIAITQASAPHAAASFVSLAKHGFFNHTVFWRIVPGFVIQGGDPTGAGSGGPGYATVDTVAANSHYREGVVAMAKTAAAVPGTAGSQFFVVTEPDASTLQPVYAIIGKVTRGLNVVETIGKLGNAEQQPTMIVEIEKAAVSESG